MAKKKRWTITSDKFLSIDQIKNLIENLTLERDLAIARSNNEQAIRDYYCIRTLLETGVREFEFCALVNSDFHGQKLNVRHGKGNKPRTVLLTKSTGLMLNEWKSVKARLGFDGHDHSPLFPTRSGEHYSTRGLRKRIKSVFQRLNFPDHLSGHSLRHTHCSMLLETKKVSIASVMNNLGHSSIAITDLYSHAIGSFSDDVELYPDQSSDLLQKSELRKKKIVTSEGNLIEAYLRKRN